MNRFGVVGLVLVMALGMVGAVLMMEKTAVAQPTHIDNQFAGLGGQTEDECMGMNLLENPGFEGQYSTYIYPEPGHIDCGLTGQVSTFCNRAQMPDGWHPRWRADGEPPPNDFFIAPEYLPSTPDQVNPDRVLSGDKSLHYFSFWSQHESAVFQQIGVEPGDNYCFSVWGHAWSDRNSDDWYSAPPDRPQDDGLLYQRVGIDPTGGTVFTASTVIWADERKQYDLFGLFKIEAEAVSPTMTVFLYSRADFPVKHNEAYWDQAAFTRTQMDEMIVSPDQVTWLQALSPTARLTQTVQVSVTSGVSWTAVLDNGTLTPTVSPLVGNAGDNITITIDTANYLTGTYTATLTITAYLTETMNSPATVPIKLLHVPEVWQVFLPMVMKP